MLGLGPAAALLSLGSQHLPALGSLGAALGSERPFHAAPLTHKCSTKRTLGRVCSAQPVGEMFLLKHFPLVFLQTLLEMEEEILGVQGSQHEIHISWLSG